MYRNARKQRRRGIAYLGKVIVAVAGVASGAGCLVSAVNRGVIVTLSPRVVAGQICDEGALRSTVAHIIDETGHAGHACRVGRLSPPVHEHEIEISCSVDVSDAEVWWWLQTMAEQAAREGCEVELGAGSDYSFWGP
jgi:hypothetical protein